MQRQPPLIRGDAPLVGTGMERVTARDSGAVDTCKRDGIVDQVDSERIIVRVESDHSGVLEPRSGRGHLSASSDSSVRTEHLHQPRNRLVRVGDRVKEDQVLRDGPCTERGELPSDVMCSSRSFLARLQLRRRHPGQRQAGQDDCYTSIHIECRWTRRGSAPK